MGISDDIHPAIRPHPKKKPQEKPLEPDEIKIKYSREEDEEDDDSLKHQRSQMEDDFFDDFRTKQKNYYNEENTRQQIEKSEEEPKIINKKETAPQPKKHGNPMTKWVVLLVLILIALLVWQNWSKISKVIGWDDKADSTEESLPNYSSATTGTDYTNGTTSSTPTATSTPAPAATTTPSIDQSKITIQLLNGNGISGSANQVKTQLVAAGFTIDSVTNARKFSYPSSIIYYKTGKSAEADLVKSALSDRQCELTNSDTIVGNYDIVVVIGKT